MSVFCRWFGLMAGMIMILLFSACTTTKTELSSWVNPQVGHFHTRHVLVIAVVPREPMREVFESKIVEELQAQGIKATPSFKVSRISHWQDKTQLESLIHELRADSVLIAELIGVEEKEVVHPPQTYSVPAGGYYGYYMYGWRTVHQPGYVTRHQVVRIESNLYDARKDQLVWSARSQTIDPENALNAMDSVIAAMMADLKDKGLIGH